jgi:hypothetical protein
MKCRSILSSLFALLLLALFLNGCGGSSGNANSPNSVSLQSDAGEYVGAGKSYNYSSANAKISVTSTGNLLTVAVTGDESWQGTFQLPAGETVVKRGDFANLSRYQPGNPNGGLDWNGDGRGCSTLSGRFSVDKASYVNGVLTAVDLRFEQHNEGAAPALHGQLHWNADDKTVPPGPVNPPPEGLWHPANPTPSGNVFVYLESQPGDFVGAGQSYSYTPANSKISVQAAGGHLAVTVTGDQRWQGDFQTMEGVTALRPGFYGNLERYPFHNPVKGGLDWFGDGRGCNTLSGWFVVDHATYQAGVLTSLDLRFEQHGEGGTPALHGQIHWRSDDTTVPPGPVIPPADLWQPSGATPSGDVYVYLESDPGDLIGDGELYSYSPANAQIAVSAEGGHLTVTVNGSGSDFWRGDFVTMEGLTTLQPGYYPGLLRYPFNNPVKGGLDWGGNGRDSNTLTGWFVIDEASYQGGVLTSLDLRFEQHSAGLAPALHGKIHWANQVVF